MNTTRNYFILFAIYVCLHTLLDFFYIFFTSHSLKRHFASIQKLSSIDKVEYRFWPYGLIAYLILFFSVWYFLIYRIAQATMQKEEKTKVWKIIVFDSFMFALVVWGIYNFTNATTLAPRDHTVIMVDMLWGICSIMFLSFITYLITSFAFSE